MRVLCSLKVPIIILLGCLPVFGFCLSMSVENWLLTGSFLKDQRTPNTLLMAAKFKVHEDSTPTTQYGLRNFAKICYRTHLKRKGTNILKFGRNLSIFKI